MAGEAGLDLGEHAVGRVDQHEIVLRARGRLLRDRPEDVAADGLVVVETDARTEPELPLPVRTSRKYGQTRVTLFEAAQ